MKLQRCFESVKKIQSESYECILVDDGSEAKTAAFCKRYSKINRCFKYIRKENNGVSSARNAGIEVSCGEYICFVDSDDEILPKEYSLFLEEAYDADIIFSDLVLVDRGKKARWRVCEAKEISYEIMIKRVLSDEKANGPCCKFIRKKFLCQYGIKFRENMATSEDLAFLLDILINRPSCLYINRVSYYYYRDASTGLDRLKKYTINYFDCCKIIYFMKITCIDKSQLSVNEKKHLNIRAEEQYLQNIFNIVLEMIEAGIHLQNVNQNIISALDLTDTKRANIRTKIRKELLLRKKWKTLKLLSCIRRKYLDIKGLI